MELKQDSDKPKKAITTIESFEEAMILLSSFIPPQKLGKFLVFHALDHGTMRELQDALEPSKYGSGNDPQVVFTKRQLHQIRANVAPWRDSVANRSYVRTGISISQTVTDYLGNR